MHILTFIGLMVICWMVTKWEREEERKKKEEKALEQARVEQILKAIADLKQ